MFIVAYNVASLLSLARGRVAPVFARSSLSLLLNSRLVDDGAEVGDDDDASNDAADSWRLDDLVEILIGAKGLSESIGRVCVDSCRGVDVVSVDIPLRSLSQKALTKACVSSCGVNISGRSDGGDL